MTTVGVIGAKGGCGASLVAANLALSLVRHGRTLLVDLHNGDGTDDLLLDLRPERSWADLRSVAGELEARHLDLTTMVHPGGLRFLAAPPDPVQKEAVPAVLLESLDKNFDWLVLDLASSVGEPPPVEVLAIVTTPDPPALRGVQSRLRRLSPEARPHARLVLNQFTRAHPGHPVSIASALDCPLLGVLPPDPRAVGFQVGFGRACALDGRSSFGRGTAAMARTLALSRSAGRAAA